MLDVFHIPSNTDNTKIFYAQGTTDWQTWEKPRGAKMIQIFCLGSGGSGGLGAAANGSRQGGGGGASAAITKAIIPAFLLPDVLYIQVALGGAARNQASTVNVVGLPGANSYVSLAPSTTATAVVIASSTAAAGGGTATAGPGALAATVYTTAVGVFGSLAIFSTIAGVNGGVQTAVGNPGTSLTALASTLVTGGASGGPGQSTIGYNGGSIISASVILTTQVNGGLGVSSSLQAPRGNDGYTIMNPFCSTGGGGGAGNGQGPAGNGGDAGLGSGGGGGGGGQVNITRLSGKGGDGIVIITTIT